MSREIRDTHMEAVWADGQTKDKEKNALAQKKGGVHLDAECIFR